MNKKTVFRAFQSLICGIGCSLFFMCYSITTSYCDTGDITENIVISSGTTTAIHCPTRAGAPDPLSIPADLNNNGTEDIKVLLISENGECYGSEYAGNKEILYSYKNNDCLGSCQCTEEPGCLPSEPPCVQGIFKIRFVEPTGFDPTNEATWVNKHIPALSFAVQHNSCSLQGNSTFSAKARTSVGGADIQICNCSGSECEHPNYMECKFFDNSDGIGEVVLETAFCENRLDDFKLLIPPSPPALLRLQTE